MNYYERHLGDYAKDTGHLSMLEHGAYTLLLDRYYATEAGIPADQVYRVARARTKEERDAVDVVLSEFFALVDGVWIKNRCDEEIRRAHLKIETARQNGRSGGRPKRTQQKPSGLSDENPTQTQQKPSGFPVGSKTETQHITQTKALQSPVSRHQSPDTEQPSSVASTTVEARLTELGTGEEGRRREIAPEAALAIPLREAGVKVTSMHPLLVAWVRDGFTLEQALGAVAVARSQLGEQQEIAAKYLDTILRNPPKPGSGNGSGGNGAAHRTKFDRLRARLHEGTTGAEHGEDLGF